MEGDKRGSVTYCTAREDEVNMILILSLQYYLSDRFDKRFQVSKQNSFKQLTTSKAKRVNPKSLLSRYNVCLFVSTANFTLINSNTLLGFQKKPRNGL